MSEKHPAGLQDFWVFTSRTVKTGQHASEMIAEACNHGLRSAKKLGGDFIELLLSLHKLRLGMSQAAGGTSGAR